MTVDGDMVAALALTAGFVVVLGIGLAVPWVRDRWADALGRCGWTW